MPDLLPQWVLDGPVAHRVRGADIQTVEFLLRPGDRIIAEPETFLCAVGGVRGLDVNFGRRARDLFTRKWAGESTILQEVVCTDAPARVVMGAPRLGRIIRVPLRGGRSVVCQRGAFVCATGQIDIGVAVAGRVRAGLFGGQGLLFQRLSGEGDVFLQAVGSVIDWLLPAHQIARVRTRNILAFDDSVGYDVQISGSAMSLMFGIQQLFLSQLEGPGRVIVQSMDVAGGPGPQAAHAGQPRSWRRASLVAADTTGDAP